MNTINKSEKGELKKERSELLQQVEEWLETPMLVLGFAWLVQLGVNTQTIRQPRLYPYMSTLKVWPLFD